MFVSSARVCGSHSHGRAPVRGSRTGDAQIPTKDELDPNRESPEERERRERLQRLKHLRTAIMVFLASCAVYFFVSVLRGCTARPLGLAGHLRANHAPLRARLQASHNRHVRMPVAH